MQRSNDLTPLRGTVEIIRIMLWHFTSVMSESTTTRKSGGLNLSAFGVIFPLEAGKGKSTQCFIR